LSIVGSLDTNVLVRLVVRDDEAQTALVARLLDRHVRRSESLWVAATVMLELEWVLRSRYKFAKAEVIRTLSALLTTMELVFESEGALEQSLASYEEGVADFGEYLHLALAQYGLALPFWTFDAKAAKAGGAKLLKT
jgi:predicted nucleic-acid-binding protein